MPSKITPAEQRESTHLLGEMAAARLFAVVHERLEELREKQSLTQADLAKRLGVSEQHVSKWLKEPRNMTVRAAGRLMAALEAHLLFELDRFEDIEGGNGVAQGVVARQTSKVVNPPPRQVYQPSETGLIAAPTRPLVMAD